MQQQHLHQRLPQENPLILLGGAAANRLHSHALPMFSEEFVPYFSKIFMKYRYNITPGAFVAQVGSLS